MPFGIHICMDEIRGFLFCVPFAAAAWCWVLAKLYPKPCCDQHHEHESVEQTETEPTE